MENAIDYRVKPDPEYIAARDALIPFSSLFADAVAGDAPKRQGRKAMQAWADRWNEVFFATMNKLARQHNLYAEKEINDVRDAEVDRSLEEHIGEGRDVPVWKLRRGEGPDFQEYLQERGEAPRLQPLSVRQGEEGRGCCG
jgi:hypothetical protein